VGSPKRTSYETSANFHKWKYEHMKTRGFASYKHGKATKKTRNSRRNAQEHQNEHFTRYFLQFFTLHSFKTDIFLRIFSGTWNFATSKSIFRTRFPSILNISQKIPHLSRNLHLVGTWHRLPMQSEKNLQHNISKILYPPYKITITISKVLRLPRKLQFIL
jgi:hypothetical protein